MRRSRSEWRALRFFVITALAITAGVSRSGPPLPSQEVKPFPDAHSPQVKGDIRRFHYEINADHSFELEFFQSAPVRTRADAKVFARTPLPFGGDISKPEVLEAYTLLKDGKTRVPARARKVKKGTPPVRSPRGAGPRGANDDFRALEISFRNLEVGARVVLHMKQSYLRPSAVDAFDDRKVFNVPDQYAEIEVTATSRKPLYYQTGTRFPIPATILHESDGLYRLKASLRAPVIVPESDFNKTAFRQIADLAFPYFAISTIATPDEYARRFYRAWKPFLGEELPAAFSLFASTLKGLSPEEKIVRTMRYVTETVGINPPGPGLAGILPNTLRKIATSGGGDCKEAALLTVALLRHLGIAAEVTAMSLEQMDLNDRLKIGTFAFDHVIVRAEIPRAAAEGDVKGSAENKIYWVEPAAADTFPNPPPEYWGRRVVTLSENPQVAFIQPQDGAPVESTLTSDLTARLKADGSGTFSGKIRVTGFETRLLEMKRSIGEKFFDAAVGGMFASQGIPTKIRADVKFDTTRPTHAVDIDGEFAVKDAATFFTGKLNRRKRDHLVSFSYFAGIPRVDADLPPDLDAVWMNLGYPRRIDEKLTLVGKVIEEKSKEHAYPTCRIHTPWIDLERTIAVHEDRAVITSHFEQKTHEIRGEALKSEEFRSLYRAWRECLKEAALRIAIK